MDDFMTKDSGRDPLQPTNHQAEDEIMEDRIRTIQAPSDDEMVDSHGFAAKQRMASNTGGQVVVSRTGKASQPRQQQN